MADIEAITIGDIGLINCFIGSTGDNQHLVDIDMNLGDIAEVFDNFETTLRKLKDSNGLPGSSDADIFTVRKACESIGRMQLSITELLHQHHTGRILVSTLEQAGKNFVEMHEKLVPCASIIARKQRTTETFRHIGMSIFYVLRKLHRTGVYGHRYEESYGCISDLFGAISNDAAIDKVRIDLIRNCKYRLPDGPKYIPLITDITFGFVSTFPDVNKDDNKEETE